MIQHSYYGLLMFQQTSNRKPISVLVVGNSRVGKTTIIDRYIGNIGKNYRPGTRDVTEKYFCLNVQRVRFRGDYCRFDFS